MTSTTCCARIFTSIMSDGTPDWKMAVGSRRFLTPAMCSRGREYESAKKDALNPTSRPFFRHVFEDSIHPVVEAGKACLVDGVHELLDQLTLAPGARALAWPFSHRAEIGRGRRGVRRRHPALADPGSLVGMEHPRLLGQTNGGGFAARASRILRVRRTRFCCPATSKRRTSGGSNERGGRSPSTSDGSISPGHTSKGGSAAH